MIFTLLCFKNKNHTLSELFLMPDFFGFVLSSNYCNIWFQFSTPNILEVCNFLVAKLSNEDEANRNDRTGDLTDGNP